MPPGAVSGHFRYFRVLTFCAGITTFVNPNDLVYENDLPVLLLLGVIGAARAQQPDTQSATASVEELSAEVAALKAKTSTWDKVLAALPKISGYVQTGYEWSDNSSTFFIKRVRLNLAGAIAPKLDYRVQIEFASPKIVDAYLCYKPFDELNVQLGEYKLPFSIENTDYVPLRYEFIEYPLSLRKLMGFNDLCGLSATGRDMGAQLFGGFSSATIQYPELQLRRFQRRGAERQG